jgi:hypothetical protein
MVEKVMTIKDELKKIIEEMENTMSIMERCASSSSLNTEWAIGSWQTLDVFKPRLEALLNKLIKEDVPYEDRPR